MKRCDRVCEVCGSGGERCTFERCCSCWWGRPCRGRTPCAQCKRPLGPIDAMMGPVCGLCARDNHRGATS